VDAGNFTFNVDSLKKGTNQFILMARDEAGNESVVKFKVKRKK